ncbi:dehydrogenase/reductase SDR family member 7-like [Onychomys torridus]|uniref:dehydrogenase/reductase SDR family member 7-like n=1 Tax=Onychomys torridus TaxID=38674 RepID=UPI00167F1DFB|nr:dehydrogenase/reductase SDR family member 7-like [Onychomys torridus]
MSQPARVHAQPCLFSEDADGRSERMGFGVLKKREGEQIENSNLKEKEILVLPLDLTDTSSHEAATKAVLQEFGKIDILVNNSGRSQRSLVLETNLDVFKELINLNYLGTVSLTKCVLPHMVERKQGKIVTVNSIAGIASVPLSSGYCASKHALRVRQPKLCA